MKKCIVVHSGNRDFYQVALALEEKGWLTALITDDFIFRKHRPKEIGKHVVTSWTAVFFLLLHRIFRHGAINRYKDQALSKKASRIARQKKADIILAYSYYSQQAFRDFPGLKVLFQLHPHPASVRRILSEEITLNPGSRASVEQEHEFLLTNREFELLASEAANADRIIVASGFTRRTLLEHAIPEGRIHVVPYGVDLSSFTLQRNPKDEETFRVLFVGSWNQRKGLSYVAQSVAILQERYKIELHVCGRGIKDKTLVTDYLSSGVYFYQDVSGTELKHLYQNSQVFVFPSLCEGFGHVILEAMSSGLPVITTMNTAGADIIEHGKDGFLVPLRDVDAICLHLEWLIQNRISCREMGIKARHKAEQFTYQQFRKGVIKVVET